MKRKNKEASKTQDKELIRKIREIPIKETVKYGLNNGNELQVKRLNKSTFQIRIEDHYRSDFAPVVICKVKNASSYSCYPFFNLKPILIFGLGGSALTFILFSLRNIEHLTFIISLPLLFTIGIQLLLMPTIYLITLKYFRNRLV